MTGIDSWSTTAATNATADGGSINWAEGQNPSTVNNTARQMMTDVRNAFNDLVWFQYGKGDQGASNLATPCVYASATTFTIAGTDVTTPFHAGRRVKAVGASTGTIYGYISSSAFSTNTTVTMVWDSGSLANETLTVYLSQIPVTGQPLAVPSYTKITNGSAAATITNSSSGTAAQAGYNVNNGSTSAQFTQLGASYTTSGMFRQDSTLITSSGTGGIGIFTTTNQPIYIGVNSTQVASLTSTTTTLQGALLANASNTGKFSAKSTSATSVVNGGTTDLAINVGAGTFGGILVVTQITHGNANVVTNTVYAIAGRVTAFSSASIGTVNGGGGGSSFTVTCPSDGTVRVTNTSGSTTDVDIVFLGGPGS